MTPLQKSFLLLALLATMLCRAGAEPVVPGYAALKRSGEASAEQLGEFLINELNCVGCHAAPA
ncbi:MAG: hypothetical protein O3C57_01445, partial [Verrucomicrobia bacterium]|nr:hypothetical protein [Verrucomicrobiota bacterium]